MTKQTLQLDIDAFAEDVEALRAQLDEERSDEDLAHLQRVRRFSTFLLVIGWAFAWIPFNPVTIVALAWARTIRWCCVAHHVLHRGYDQVPGVPDRLTSKMFAKGWWRRLIDWPDVLEPDAWNREHNQIHHYRLGEDVDADVVELNNELLLQLPRALRVPFAAVVACVWKWVYFAPSNRREFIDTRDGHRSPPDREERIDVGLLLPWNKYGREIWATSFIPAGLLLVLPPLLFLPFGWEWAAFALLNTLLAEVLTNLHSFGIVVTNHAGDDVYRFDHKTRNRGEFYIRAIVGSVNFRTGGFFNDLAHGWLNYQIEHHVWPDLSMRQYAIAQPRLKALCAKHHVPYLQESIWKRIAKLLPVLRGDVVSPMLDLRRGRSQAT